MTFSRNYLDGLVESLVKSLKKEAEGRSLSFETVNAYVSEMSMLAILLAIWKYLEDITRFSNCQQSHRAQISSFMESFASDLSTVHSEILMDMSIASELEGKSSIEAWTESSLRKMKQLELIAVMIGSSVMNCARHSISCSDAILKYICRKLFDLLMSLFQRMKRVRRAVKLL